MERSRNEQCCSKCKTVPRDNHVNRESKSLELTIKLYIFYDEHEAPSCCNIIFYVSWLLNSEEVLGGKFTGEEKFTHCEFSAVNMKNCVNIERSMVVTSTSPCTYS